MSDLTVPTGALDDVAIRVTFPNIPLVTNTAEQNAALVTRIQANAASVALHHLADLILQVAPKDQGALGESFGFDPATEVGGIELTGHSFAEEEVVGRIFSTLPQAVVLEDGRAAGSYVNREGLDALAAWAERKLGLSADQADRIKWALATVIRQRGLEGRHYVEQALDLAEPGFEEIFANAGQAIADALGAEG
jgi:hypothetical protein